MLVTFHGVRGSTPCHGDDIARYGGNTSCVSVDAAGEDPLLFDLGTGLRYFGLGVPGDEPFRGTCLVSHLHWDHVQGLPFFGPLQHEDSELVVYAPAQDDGRTAAEVLGVDDLPADVPDRARRVPRPDRDPRAGRRSSSIGGFDVESGAVPHVGETLGYRVTHGGVERRLRQRPPAAARAGRTSPTSVVRAVRGRRPADPRRPVHAGRVRPQEHWGHCTVEYAVWLAGEVGAKRLALFHHDPGHNDDMIDRLAAAAVGVRRGDGCGGLRRPRGPGGRPRRG